MTRQLKSGGFGNTYVVENVLFGETYAMKEFFMQGVTTRSGTLVSVSIEDNAKAFNEQKEKFKKEAQRIRKLSHPNIVRIHDLFEDNGTCYYVMDFIDGESLADWVKTHGAMPEAEALRVLNSALDALGVVHAAGLAHMDVTPRNIMRAKNGNVFLIDFGASKQIVSSELRTLSSTAMPYSPGYAPTEQMNKEANRIGPWTDLYALGATMFRLLTTRRPPSSSEVVSFSMNGADPFHFANDITKSTQSLIKWMMHPAIEKRPQSVDEVRKRMANMESGDDIEATVYDSSNASDSSSLPLGANDSGKLSVSQQNEKEGGSLPIAISAKLERESYVEVTSEPSGATVYIGNKFGFISISLTAIIIVIVVGTSLFRNCFHNDYNRVFEVDADSITIVDGIDTVAADTVTISSVEYKQLPKTKDMNIQDNTWLEAAEAELEEQGDIIVKPLQEQELELDLESESVDEQLQDAKKRLDSLKQQEK